MWNRTEELAYWKAEEDHYYLANIQLKHDFFETIKYFHVKENYTAIDIGGGKFGGALYGYSHCRAKTKILVDALAYEFRLMGKLPAYIDSITAEFSNIPLKSEIADALFTWNVYDHADTPEHFFKGLEEANRILKVGGLWFASFPMRKVPNNNHPICIEEHWIKNWFLGHQIIDVKRIHEPHYRDEILFLVARKTAL